MFGLIKYNFLSHIGFSFLLLSYLVTNVLYLRILLTISSFILALWSIIVLDGDAAISSFIWNILFFFINFIHTLILKNKNYKSDKTSIPGNNLPSNNSRLAPPPVLT